MEARRMHCYTLPLLGRCTLVWRSQLLEVLKVLKVLKVLGVRRAPTEV